jgi:LysM repeat protein
MRVKALLIALLSATVVTIAGSAPAHAEAPADKKIVTVEPGDYLAEIAQEHQTVYTRLFDANAEIQHPDVIHPGQNIRIPSADEVLPSRALPSTTPAVTAPSTPAPVAQAAPRQAQAAPADTNIDGGVWDRLARCESGGNWAINSGNGYYGGLQFSLSSWQAVGGSGYPHQASKAEQISRAEALLARQGWGAWPACTAKLGLR